VWAFPRASTETILRVVLEACHRPALNEGQKENKSDEEMEK